MIGYALLALVVLLGGWTVAIPFMTLSTFHAVYILSCLVVFLLMENWTLAQDIQQPGLVSELSSQNKALVKRNEFLSSRNLVYSGLCLALMHWKLLAHKALALNEVGKLTHRKRALSRSHSCDSKK